MIYKGSIVKGSGGGSGDAVWGSITGTLSDQTDLQTALNAKQDTLTAGSNITISGDTISATDTTYTAFTGATGSVAGSAGLVPEPAATDNDKYLKGDGTWATVSSDGLVNTSDAGSINLGILGTIDSGSRNTALGAQSRIGSVSNSTVIGGQAMTFGNRSIAIGSSSLANYDDAVTIGYNSQARSQYSSAIGVYARVDDNSEYSIQIGEGTTNTPYTLSIGFGLDENSNPINYKLLDGTTGKIPNDRLNAFTGATGSVAGSAGAVPAPTTSDVGKFLSADGTWATAGGSVSFDGSTINENASNELQAIGVIDKNSGSALAFWHGTEAQWNNGGEVKDTYYDWEYVSSNVSQNLTTSGTWHIASGNGMSVAVSWQGNANYSTDKGASWNSSPLSSGSYNTIVYGNGKFITFSYGAGFAYYTTDATSWQPVALNITAYWNASAFGNNTFIAIGSNSTIGVYSTDDGASWNSMTLPQTSNWKSACYSSKTNEFYVLSENGIIIASSDVTVANSWEIRASLNLSYMRGIACDDNGLLVIVGDDGVAYKSIDGGRNWTNIIIQPVNQDSYLNIIYADNKFVICVTNNNKVFYSNNADNWKEASISITQSWASISYDNDTFIQVANASKYTNRFNFNSVYTLDAEPTTSSQVYSAPEVTSALTITSVGIGTITLSDTNTYTYNSGGNAYSYYSVGESYPNYLCFIDGVGVKYGTTTIISYERP